MASKGTLGAIAIIFIVTIGAGAYMILYNNPFGPKPNPYSAAIIFSAGGLGDQGINDACYDGAIEASQQFNIQFIYSEPDSVNDYREDMRFYASHVGYTDPYDLIICIGEDMVNVLMEAADKHPNQQFAIVDPYTDLSGYSNIAALVFNENEGSALVGAIAAKMTKTGRVGFIGGSDDEMVSRYAAGYVFGANYTFPFINYTVAYTGSWTDRTAGSALADSMYSTGIDVIYAVAGLSSLGVYDSAKRNNDNSSYPLWVIGADIPQMYLGCANPNAPVPPTIGLTSMIKRYDIAILTVIKSVYNGTFHAGDYVLSLANDGLDYEINTALLNLPTNATKAAESLKAAIISGSVMVPDYIYWT